MDELTRILMAAEMAALLFCGAYLHHGYRKALPGPLWRVGFAYASVLGAVTIGVAVNLIGNVALTPGALFFAVASAPAAVVVTWSTARVIRHR